MRVLLWVKAVPLCADCCPADPDQVAEAYCMDALGAADGAAFEVHLLECGECRAIVEATEEYAGTSGPGGPSTAKPPRGDSRA